MLFAESFNFLSMECMPLEVDDEKKKMKEVVTVSSESLLLTGLFLA